MQVQEVLKGLQALLSRNSAENLGHMFLHNLKPEDVDACIKNNTSLVRLCFNEWHLSHPIVKPLAKFIIKANYNDMAKLLTNVPEVYKVLVENPSIIPVIDTPAGRSWLNHQCKDFYTAIYMYTWTNADPLESLGFKNPYKKGV